MILSNNPLLPSEESTTNQQYYKTMILRKFTVLEYLIAAPESINPVLSVCQKVQHLELIGELDNEKIDSLADEIETAIEIGNKFRSDVKATIDLLKKCSPATALIPEGF